MTNRHERMRGIISLNPHCSRHECGPHQARLHQVSQSSCSLRGLLMPGAVTLLAVMILPHRAPAQESIPPAISRRPDAALWVGVNSCAATACHGGRAGQAGGEYTTWITRDPHAQAYSVLYDERSLQMVRNLRGPEEPLDVPPHEDQACLICHAPSGASHDPRQYLGSHAPRPYLGSHAPRPYLGDGVGCETCHGAAGDWVAEHSKIDWQPLSAARRGKLRTELGMIDTRDALPRARQCVECHVGGEGRDVNHDLIAAGHPRLSFEFTTYLHTLPAHWDEQAERKSEPGYLARGWMVGQAVSAAAAMKLLQHRAGDDAIWPEFAEYDCFSCHHDLVSPSWRQRRRHGGRPGRLSWGSWYYALPRTITAVRKEGKVDQLGLLTPAFLKHPADFDPSRGLMAATLRDREKVQHAAGAASAQLADWAEKLNDPKLYTPEFTADLLSTVADDPLEIAGTSWDASAQMYLALVALHRARLDQQGADTLTRRDQEIVAALRALRSDLRYAESSGENPRRYESPRDFNPERFRTNLTKLRQTLSRP